MERRHSLDGLFAPLDDGECNMTNEEWDKIFDDDFCEEIKSLFRQDQEDIIEILEDMFKEYNVRAEADLEMEMVDNQ